MVVNLTKGAIMTMCFTSEELQPVLQVIDLELKQLNNGTERYSLLLSDGSYYHKGLLATCKNELVHSGRLQRGSVVKLTQFASTHLPNRKIIVIIELDVILDKCDLIGEPSPAPKEPLTQDFSEPSLSETTHIVQ